MLPADDAGVAAFLLADSRLPSGAYSHSAGLEPAVIAGLDADGVYPYLLARLHTAGRVETAAAVLAHRVACGLANTGYPRIEAAIDARTPSAAQRDASRRLGRGMLRLASKLRPDAPAVVELQRTVPRPTRPVALAVTAAALGVGELQLARLCCYDDAQSVVAAALKLLPIDPMEATGWILAAAGEMDAVAAESLLVGSVDDIPALSAPLMEHWAENHTTRTRRLFVA
ncbi:urease accessory protein UreF [Arthrobacter zhaoxinii]|uniref:urease accessory protein UreF n=1 Tax=Arthrobacter zhaoxinii TaxID=2964616 RepID=UPI0021048D03|nr:urease accessory UreF family protein [Arthrobacter zhaoxinii]MCQ2001595.1 urease accessory protein [Arthrobacter zhaoxinii]